MRPCPFHVTHTPAFKAVVDLFGQLQSHDHHHRFSQPGNKKGSDVKHIHSHRRPVLQGLDGLLPIHHSSGYGDRKRILFYPFYLPEIERVEDIARDRLQRLLAHSQVDARCGKINRLLLGARRGVFLDQLMVQARQKVLLFALRYQACKKLLVIRGA